MIQIYLKNIHCDEETNEVGADEPYVFVTAVNLASTVNVSGFPVPLPSFEVVRYGPFKMSIRAKGILHLVSLNPSGV